MQEMRTQLQLEWTLSVRHTDCRRELLWGSVHASSVLSVHARVYIASVSAQYGLDILHFWDVDGMGDRASSSYPPRSVPALQKGAGARKAHPIIMLQGDQLGLNFPRCISRQSIFRPIFNLSDKPASQPASQIMRSFQDGTRSRLE